MPAGSASSPTLDGERDARRRQAGARDPREPHPPRRRGLRSVHRRRRGHPPADPARFLRGGARGRAASSSRRPATTRVAMCFFSRDPARRRQQRGDPRGRGPAPRPARARLARRPDRRRGARPHRARVACRSIRQLFIGRDAARRRRSSARSTSSASAPAARAELGATTSTSRRCSSQHGRLQGADARRAARRRSTPTSATRAPSRALAMVHSRFSTNTFPTWERAHPLPPHRAQRRDQHAARQPRVDVGARSAARRASSSARRIEDFKPIIRAGRLATRRRSTTWSTSSSRAGRSLPHVMMMLVPEAWAHDPDMSDEKKALLRVPRLPRRAVGRPRRARASPTASSSARRSIATASARRSTSSRPTGWSSWRASSACSTSIPRASIAEGAPAARQDVPRRHRRRARRLRRGDQAAGRDAEARIAAWVAENKIDLAQLDRRRRASTRSTADELLAPAAGVRLHRRGPAR